MSESLIHVIRGYAMKRLASQVTAVPVESRQAEEKAREINGRLEAEARALVEGLLRPFVSGIEQLDASIAQAASEFSLAAQRLIADLGRAESAATDLTLAESIPDQINAIAREAAEKIRSVHEKGDLSQTDLIALIGKIEAYKTSIYASLDQTGLSEERRSRLAADLLHKYRRSVEETVQAIVSKQADERHEEKHDKRNKLWGLF